MRALVTGGAGFIGANLVGLLLGEGHDVLVLDDLSSGYEENLLPGAEFLRADVSDSDMVRAAAAGRDVVFHLAASVGNTRSIERPRRDSEVNVLGTVTVLEAARDAGIRRVVLSSSAGIFGELKTLPIAEDHPQNPDSPYGVSKLAAEHMCLAYNRLHGMKNVCLRYFNVYGPLQRYDAYGNAIPIFAERMLRHEPVEVFGDGEQTRDFINVHDVARANFSAAIAADATGVFNLGSGTRVTINHLVEAMAQLSGESQRVVYGPPRRGDVRDSLAAIEKAERILGFRPVVGLAEGLTDYFSWLRGDSVTRRRWLTES